MPRAEFNKFKGKEEYLIFVKNVPAYLADKAVPKMFKQYDPIRFKDVYPNSDVTTVVIGFRTHEEAQYAQQETDGARVENVVLRVEMYDKHRSVRYLQEVRSNSTPRGASYADDNDGVEQEEEEEPVQEPEHVPPFPRTQEQETSGVTTWANIAGKNRAPTGIMPLPPPPTAPKTKQPVPDDNTAKFTPILQVVVPYIAALHKTGKSNSEVTAVDSFPERSPSKISIVTAGYEGDVEDNRKSEKQPPPAKEEIPVRTSLFAPWQPIDSTARFAQRHCRDCMFCKMRERSKVDRGDQYADPSKIL